MNHRLTTERKIYNENIEGWRTTHLGEFVLIKDARVIGFFRSLDEAVKTGIGQFGMEDFFIEQILPVDMTNISFVGQVV